MVRPPLVEALLQVLAVVVLGWPLVGGLVGDMQCVEREVKQALQACHPEMSYVNTAVLKAAPGDYAPVCRTFVQYISCVDPSVLQCQTRLLRQFWATRRTYTEPPYNCTTPRTPSTDSVHGNLTHPSVTSTACGMLTNHPTQTCLLTLVGMWGVALVIDRLMLQVDWAWRSHGTWMDIDKG